MSVIRSIVNVNPVYLKHEPRVPPRNPELMEPEYMQQFDSSTMWYDVFYDGQSVIALGPPLINHWRSVINGELFVVDKDDQYCLKPFEIRGRDKCFWLSVKCTNPLSIKLVTQKDTYEATVSTSLEEWFTGRRVLLTKSKNNKLRWISDWIKHHVQIHGCDAVLLYDNHSTDYSVDDLLDCISSEPAIKAAIIVSWNFPYGVSGHATGIWDSDYSQHCMLEHARRRFLGKARSVLSCDIDELAMTKTGASIFELCENSATRYICFPGQWLDCCEIEGDEATICHDDHRYLIKNSICTTKWAVVPASCPESTQWLIHRIWQMPIATESEDAYFFHFSGISTSWKYNRPFVNTFNPLVHEMIPHRFNYI